MKFLILLSVFIFVTSFQVRAQRKIIHLPDMPGYLTLKCDFHTHTMFSDGDVWPEVRIEEAYRDGLDVIAITDHIEYTPHKDYVPVDLNAGWKITEKFARERNIILVHGAEITKSMPPGHFNALYITDASALAKDSVWDAVQAAISQGAFIQWNHPGWSGQQYDGISRMYDIHRRLIAAGWMHAIEFYNDNEYYPQVFRFCEENKLALTGNSDIHGLISEHYAGNENIHRPMTLVFAKDRTEAALKEALFERRTMVFFQDHLAGREELALPFFRSCISVSKPFYENEKNFYIEVTNSSDIPFYLINGKVNSPGTITLAASSITRIVVSKEAVFPLVYDVKNIITGENKVLTVQLK